MTQLPSPINTDPSERDWRVSALKGLAGYVPVLGPMLQEFLGQVIPNQRVDRIAAFFKDLEDKVHDLDRELVRARFSSPNFANLLEEATYQAARAVSNERTEYLAWLVRYGLDTEDVKLEQTKKLLWLLGELNDSEVILLQAFAGGFRDNAFRELHGEVIFSPGVHMRSPPEERETKAFHNSHRGQLQRLGLIVPHFRRPKRGELPEFDTQTGMMKVDRHEITPLGRLLLRHIGLPDYRDPRESKP